MKHSIAVVIVLALAGCKGPSVPNPVPKAPPVRAPAARGPTPRVDGQAVDLAIERAQEFLLARQQPDATWKDAPGTNGGVATALAIAALLESGARAQSDSRISNALDRLARLKTDSTQVLSLRARAWQLACRQNPRTYESLLREDVRHLIAASVSGGHGVNATSEAPDLLSSRFGAMGVLAGAETGLEIPRTYWAKTLEYWLVVQNVDGSWGAKTGGKSPPAMTAAGIAIVQGCLQVAFVDLPMGRPPPSAARALARAQAWLDANFANAFKTGKHLPGLLHEIERAACRTGRWHFGGVYWNRAGAVSLIASQKRNGAWDGQFGPDVTTAYALMFLSSTRKPIAFHHFRYGGDWSNWPHAMSGLTRWITRNLCGVPLTWRVVDGRTPQAVMHEAPILIITGAEAPHFTPAELSFLRTYALAGGTLWSIAEGPAFDMGMRSVYQKLFGAWKLAPCPPPHLLYTNYYKLRGRPKFQAVSNGVRAVAIHSEESSLTMSWHQRRIATRKVAFQAAMNVFMYATDKMGGFRDRGSETWPVRYQGPVKRTITIARLKYKGNYDPEPMAWERFARTMGHKTATPVNVVGPVDIDKFAATKARLAVLAGTEALALTVAEQKALKRFISGGGTLFIDAAGGDCYKGTQSKGFSTSVEQTLTGMFPKRKLAKLKADSPIYTISPEPIKKVRWRRVTHIGMLGDYTPQLKAIIIDGRPAVIFSSLDITAGLLGVTTSGIDGYQPDSAYAIMRNIVLYAAKGPADADKGK